MPRRGSCAARYEALVSVISPNRSSVPTETISAFMSPPLESACPFLHETTQFLTMESAEVPPPQLGGDDLLLPVGVVEAAALVGAERVAGEVVEDGLQDVAFHNLGEARVVVLQEAPPKAALQFYHRGIG